MDRMNRINREREQERSCVVCGRVAVARYAYCQEHLRTAEIERREAEERRELHIVAATAERKERKGQPLSPREREVLDSQRVLEERFGGKYPPPTPRPGTVYMTREGDVVDRQVLSPYLRAKHSKKILENLFCDL